MDKATKKGLENLEKSVRAEQLAESAAEADKEHVKSEQIRYDNADRIYE
jgi:hypothetical protein